MGIRDRLKKFKKPSTGLKEAISSKAKETSQAVVSGPKRRIRIPTVDLSNVHFHLPRTPAFVERRLPKFRRVSKRAQITAAILLPFFLVSSILVAEIVQQVIRTLMPASFFAINLVMFLVGTFLFVGVFAAAFLWVNTGGFNIYG